MSAVGRAATPMPPIACPTMLVRSLVDQRYWITVDTAGIAGSQVFVSYARVDVAFVRALSDGLRELGVEPWVDWQAIQPTSDWKEEIRSGIDACDAFVYVLSPESVTSAVCAEELAHAMAANKRLLPVLFRKVENSALPDALRRLHWVDAGPDTDLAHALAALCKALTVDLALLRAHKRLLVRAREWVGAGRDQSFLLRGVDLDDAQRAVGTLTQNAPTLNAEQLDYVVASQAFQRDELERWQGMYRRALARQLAAQAELLRGQRAEDLELAVLLAVESIRTAPSIEATKALQSALRLLPRAARALATTAPSSVNALATSVDGARVFTVSNDGFLRVVEVGTMLERQRFQLGERVMSVTIGGREDEEIVVCGGYESARIHVVLWQIERVVVVDVSAVATALALSADGSRLAVATRDGVLRVIQPVTSDPSSALLLQQNAHVCSLAFSPDAARLVSGGGDCTRVWNVDDGTLIWEFVHGDSVESVAYSPDGDRVAAAGRDEQLSLFVAQDGQLISAIKDVEPLNGTQFSPNGRRLLAHGCYKADLLIVDADDGRLVHKIAADSGTYFAAFDSEALQVATCGHTPVVQVWDLRLGREIARPIHQAGAEALAFRPRARSLLVAGNESWLRCVDLGRPGALQHGQPMYCAALSPNGAMVATAYGDGRVHVAPLRDVNANVTLEVGHALDVLQLSDNGTRLLVLDSENRLAEVWDVPSRCILWQQSLNDLARHFAFRSTMDRDGKLLAGGVDPSQTLSVLAVDTGQRLVTVTHEEEAPLHRAFGSKRRLWVSAAGTSVKVWDLWGVSEVFSFKHPDYVSAADFSQDERWLITGCHDGVVRIFDAKNGRLDAQLPNDSKIHGIAGSPDGAWLAVTTAASLNLWRMGDRTLVRAFKVGGSLGCAFTPDGLHVACDSTSHHAAIWRIDTGEPVASLSHEGECYSIQFSADGRYYLLRHSIGSARASTAWLWRSEDLLELASASLSREMTSEERSRFLT